MDCVSLLQSYYKLAHVKFTRILWSITHILEEKGIALTAKYFALLASLDRALSDVQHSFLTPKFTSLLSG